MDSEEKTDLKLPHPKRTQSGPETGSRRARTRSLVIVGIIALAAVAAMLAWLFGRPTESGQAGRPVPAPVGAGSAVPTPSGPAGTGSQQPAGFVITLSRDKLEAAQIKTELAIQQPINS